MAISLRSGALGAVYPRSELVSVEVAEAQLERVAALNPARPADVAARADPSRRETRPAAAKLAAGWHESPRRPARCTCRRRTPASTS